MESVTERLRGMKLVSTPSKGQSRSSLWKVAHKSICKVASSTGNGKLHGPLIENNRWKAANNSNYKAPSSKGKGTLPLKSNYYGSAPGRIEQKSTPRAHTIELVGGLESIEQAKEILEACVAKESMLQCTLDRIRFHRHIKDENSTINTSNSYNVKTRTTAIGKDKYTYSVVMDFFGPEMKQGQKNKLQDVFAKYNSSGFLEWLGGAKGWRFDCSKTDRVSWKRRYVIQLNTLQSVWTLFAPDDQKYFFPDEKKRRIWRKHAELTEIVSDIRVWIERIDIVQPSGLTRQLLRNSSNGPDSLVHWAHHHPQNNRPLTVVSDATMMELVVGLIKLFQIEFNHSEDDPLGKRWRNHEKRRLNDWKDAAIVCPEWTEDHLEEKLNEEYFCKSTRWGVMN